MDELIKMDLWFAADLGYGNETCIYGYTEKPIHDPNSENTWIPNSIGADHFPICDITILNEEDRTKVLNLNPEDEPILIKSVEVMVYNEDNFDEDNEDDEDEDEPIAY